MGCYIEPTDCSPREWLEKNGTPSDGPTPVTRTTVPVCLVFNTPSFMPAAVGFDDAELRRFNHPADVRPKRWFSVSREKVRAVSDLVNYEQYSRPERFPD